MSDVNWVSTTLSPVRERVCIGQMTKVLTYSKRKNLRPSIGYTSRKRLMEFRFSPSFLRKSQRIWFVLSFVSVMGRVILLLPLLLSVLPSQSFVQKTHERDMV